MKKDQIEFLVTKVTVIQFLIAAKERMITLRESLFTPFLPTIYDSRSYTNKVLPLFYYIVWISVEMDLCIYIYTYIVIYKILIVEPGILLKKNFDPRLFFGIFGRNGERNNICVHVFYEEGRIGLLIWSHHLFDLIIIPCNTDKHLID